jgi:hypothetical protein
LRLDVENKNIPVSVLTSRGRAKHGNDKLADTHPDGTPEKKRSSSPVVARVQPREGRHHVDRACDHSNNERITNPTVLEELRAIVKDKVDTRQLLQSLDAHAGKLALAHASAEAIEVRGFSNRQFKLVVGVDLGELVQHGRVVSREAAEFAQGDTGLVHEAALDEVAGRFWEEEHAYDEDDGPCELHCDGDAVGACVLALVGGVIDDGGEEEADGDGELVGAYNGAADPFGGGFGLVEGDWAVLA